MKLNRVRLVFVALPLLILFLFGLVPTAAADPPIRTPNEIQSPFILQDTQGNNPCGFEVQLDVLTNKEVVTTFVRKNGTSFIQVTGALKVRLTNLSTGKSIDINIPGPIRIVPNADGSVTQIAPGPQLFVFDPGVAPDLPLLTLISGRSVSMFDPEGNFSLLSVQGHVEDLCAILADP
jgi:hypothetical protein